MDLIKEIIKEYLIEQTPIVLLRETAYNSVYQIGKSNKKVLRIGCRVSAEDVNFELEILDKLFSSDVPVVKWNKTQKGENFIAKDDCIAVLFDYVDGYHPVLDRLTRPTYKECYIAGKVLARIHTITENYTPKHIRNRTMFSELQRVIKDRDRFNEYIGGKDFVEQVEKALLFGQSCKTKIALIHNDYRVDNLFFRNENNISAVIDFDWSCFGSVIKDVAHSVLVWSFSDGGESCDVETIHQFIAGYNTNSDTKITYDDYFIKWIQFSALSDAATYFCDRFDEPGFEKRITRSYMYKKFLYFSH